MPRCPECGIRHPPLAMDLPSAISAQRQSNEMRNVIYAFRAGGSDRPNVSTGTNPSTGTAPASTGPDDPPPTTAASSSPSRLGDRSADPDSLAKRALRSNVAAPIVFGSVTAVPGASGAPPERAG